MTEIEVCAYSLESCVAAQNAGADRVELCAAMYDGGTTPSAGTIRIARQLLKQSQLYVMIRPRGGDFLYSDLEYRQMQEDILIAKEAEADGVVIGLLLSNGQVDVQRTSELVKLAAPLKVTFHRAFDMTVEPYQALEDIIGSGCVRILTSGQRNTAMEGMELLKELTKRSCDRISIMAGSGVGEANALLLAATGVDALHMSGKSVRDSQMEYRNPSVFMGGVPGIPEYDVVFSDESKIKAVINKIKDQK